MNHMFDGCWSLNESNIDNLDNDNLKDMKNVFKEGKLVSSLEN